MKKDSDNDGEKIRYCTIGLVNRSTGQKIIEN